MRAWSRPRCCSWWCWRRRSERWSRCYCGCRSYTRCRRCRWSCRSCRTWCWSRCRPARSRRYWWGRIRNWGWRRRSYGRCDINPAPAINVVWRCRVAALGILDLNSRAIQRVATRLDLMPQAGNGRPQQCRGAGNMRSRHGCSAGGRITTVAGIVARARVSTRSSDIRLGTIAPISRNRAAATKASDSVRSGVQSSDCIGSLIKRRWVGHRRTTGAGITRGNHHLDPSSSLGFNGSLQLVADHTTLRDRAGPGVDCNIGRLDRVAFVRRAADWVRREEKFHAFHICRRCAVALVHVTASNPLCAGRHADLVGAAIVSDRCAGCVRAVEEIVTRLWASRVRKRRHRNECCHAS